MNAATAPGQGAHNAKLLVTNGGSWEITDCNATADNIALSSMFDASLEDILWDIDTNTDIRIAQFRVYEIP